MFNTYTPKYTPAYQWKLLSECQHWFSNAVTFWYDWQAKLYDSVLVPDVSHQCAVEQASIGIPMGVRLSGAGVYLARPSPELSLCVIRTIAI